MSKILNIQNSFARCHILTNVQSWAWFHWFQQCISLKNRSANAKDIKHTKCHSMIVILQRKMDRHSATQNGSTTSNLQWIAPQPSSGYWDALVLTWNPSLSASYLGADTISLTISSFIWNLIVCVLIPLIITKALSSEERFDCNTLFKT